MLENASQTLQISKISRWSLPPDPPSISGPSAPRSVTAAYFCFLATYFKTCWNPALMAFSAVSTSVALGIISIIIVGVPIKAATSTRPVNSGEVPSLGRGRSSPWVSQNRNINLMLNNGRLVLKIKGLYELCHPFSPMPAAPSSGCQTDLPVFRVRKWDQDHRLKRP